MSRQSQKTEVVNKINIRIGDLPRKRKRRKRTLKPKNQGGFQHSPSGAFRRRTPMFAPTPMRPMYDGWARENMPTFQGHVSPHKKKESTTTGTQTQASTPLLSTAQPVPVTPTNQRTSSGTSSTASPGTMAALMEQSPGTINPTHSPGGGSLTYSPASPIGTEALNRYNERRNPSTPGIQLSPGQFPIVPSPPVLSPDPMPDQGAYDPNIPTYNPNTPLTDDSSLMSTPVSPFPPRAISYGNTGGLTPLRRVTARTPGSGFSLSLTGRPR